MKSGTITGRIKGKPVKFKGEGDSELLQVNFIVGSDKIPVVGSKYLFQDLDTTTVKIVGYIKSETVNGKLYTYVYALNIQPYTGDTQENIMYVSGRIKDIGTIQVVKKGTRAVLSFKVLDKDTDGTYSIVHCKAYNTMGYKLKFLTNGDRVLLQGKIRTVKNVLYMDIENDVFTMKNNSKDVVESNI